MYVALFIEEFEMFYKQPKSKQTILDLAQDLQRQVEKLENLLTASIDSINGLPVTLIR